MTTRYRLDFDPEYDCWVIFDKIRKEDIAEVYEEAEARVCTSALNGAYKQRLRRKRKEDEAKAHRERYLAQLAKLQTTAQGG